MKDTNEYLSALTGIRIIGKDDSLSFISNCHRAHNNSKRSNLIMYDLTKRLPPNDDDHYRYEGYIDRSKRRFIVPLYMKYLNDGVYQIEYTDHVKNVIRKAMDIADMQIVATHIYLVLFSPYENFDVVIFDFNGKHILDRYERRDGSIRIWYDNFD